MVRPGGRIALLDVSTPPNPLIRTGNNIYFGHVVPRIGAAALRRRRPTDTCRRAWPTCRRPTRWWPCSPRPDSPPSRHTQLSGGLTQLLVATRSVAGRPRLRPTMLRDHPARSTRCSTGDGGQARPERHRPRRRHALRARRRRGCRTRDGRTHRRRRRLRSTRRLRTRFDGGVARTHRHRRRAVPAGHRMRPARPRGRRAQVGGESEHDHRRRVRPAAGPPTARRRDRLARFGRFDDPAHADRRRASRSSRRRRSSSTSPRWRPPATRCAPGDLVKAVIARPIIVSSDQPIDVHAVLRRLRASFGSSYRYSIDGLIGASPGAAHRGRRRHRPIAPPRRDRAAHRRRHATTNGSPPS